MSRNTLINNASGPCPACGAPMLMIMTIYGLPLQTIIHVGEDFSQMPRKELEKAQLCSLNRETGEATRRNYKLPGE